MNFENGTPNTFNYLDNLITGHGEYGININANPNEGLIQGNIVYDNLPSNYRLQGSDVQFRLYGDADNDLSVGVSDLTAIVQNYATTGDADGLLLGDANDNGQVNGSDLLAWQRFLGFSVSSLTANSRAVPEPASGVILMLVIILGMGRW